MFKTGQGLMFRCKEPHKPRKKRGTRTEQAQERCSEKPASSSPAEVWAGPGSLAHHRSQALRKLRGRWGPGGAGVSSWESPPVWPFAHELHQKHPRCLMPALRTNKATATSSTCPLERDRVALQERLQTGGFSDGLGGVSLGEASGIRAESAQERRAASTARPSPLESETAKDKAQETDF